MYILNSIHVGREISLLSKRPLDFFRNLILAADNLAMVISMEQKK